MVYMRNQVLCKSPCSIQGPSLKGQNNCVKQLMKWIRATRDFKSQRHPVFNKATVTNHQRQIFFLDISDKKSQSDVQNVQAGVSQNERSVYNYDKVGSKCDCVRQQADLVLKSGDHSNTFILFLLIFQSFKLYQVQNLSLVIAFTSLYEFKAPFKTKGDWASASEPSTGKVIQLKFIILSIFFYFILSQILFYFILFLPILSNINVHLQ